MTRKRKRIIPVIAAALLALVGICTAVSYQTILKSLYPLKETALVEQCAQEYGVPAYLIYAVTNTESGFDPDAVSDLGALGIMQMTPDTFDWLQTKTGDDLPDEALFDKETAIRYGTLFLSMLLEEFGDENTAVAAYHAGRGRVNEWLENPDYAPDGQKLTNIPTRDTAHYVYKVSRAVEKYQKLYNL